MVSSAGLRRLGGTPPIVDMPSLSKPRETMGGRARRLTFCDDSRSAGMRLETPAGGARSGSLFGMSVPSKTVGTPRQTILWGLIETISHSGALVYSPSFLYCVRVRTRRDG